MRFSTRIKIGNITLFGMLSSTQRLSGITNKIDKDKFFIMWDMENCSLPDCIGSLKNIQEKYNLGEIFITSDIEKSYHGYCFDIVTFRRFLSIVCETKFCDWNFIRWSVVRGQATLRTSKKRNRDRQKVVAILKGHHNKIIENPIRVIYDTGINKRGMVLNIG